MCPVTKFDGWLQSHYEGEVDAHNRLETAVTTAITKWGIKTNCQQRSIVRCIHHCSCNNWCGMWIKCKQISHTAKCITNSTQLPTWHVTASVWQSCVFPVRNSPNISVIEPVSMPLFSNLSSSLEPVVIWMISDRFWWNSVAVVNPIGTSLMASA